jgi:hypothetical protein
MRLVQISNTSHQFDVQLVTLFPEGYGDDKTPFQFLIGEGLVEFVVEDGRAIGVGIFGAVGDLTERRDNTVQGQTEAWFDKIG